MFVPTSTLLVAVLAFTNGILASRNARKNADAFELRNDLVRRQEAVTVTVTDCGGEAVPPETAQPAPEPSMETSDIPDVPAPSVTPETSVPAPIESESESESVESAESSSIVPAPSTSGEEVSSVETSSPSTEVSTESAESTPSASEIPEASTSAPEEPTATNAAAAFNGIDSVLIGGAVGFAAILAL